MTLNDYQKAAERTSGNLTLWDKIRNGCYGLNGEAGECIDILKKVEFQGHTFDPNKLLDELGDVLWYVAQTATGLSVTLEYVAQHNVDKLMKRYPDGFDSERSVHRPEYVGGNSMAKIFKFTGYFIDPNGDLDADDVKVELEERTVDAIAHHVKVEEVYLGEWDDDHPLNACNCPLAECEKYFGRACHD